MKTWAQRMEICCPDMDCSGSHIGREVSQTAFFTMEFRKSSVCGDWDKSVICHATSVVIIAASFHLESVFHLGLDLSGYYFAYSCRLIIPC